MYVRGILIFFLGFIFITLIGVGFSVEAFAQFIDPAGAFMFLIVIVAVIISQGEFKAFVKAMNALLSKKYHLLAEDREKSIRLFKLIGKSVLYATALIFLIGLSSVLIFISGTSGQLPLELAFAVLMNTCIYGLFINMAFINPAINILEVRRNMDEKIQ